MAVKRFLERSGPDRVKPGEMADANDHDSVWKENLDRFLQPFLELTIPKVARLIDG